MQCSWEPRSGWGSQTWPRLSPGCWRTGVCRGPTPAPRCPRTPATPAAVAAARRASAVKARDRATDRLSNSEPAAPHRLFKVDQVQTEGLRSAPSSEIRKRWRFPSLGCERPLLVRTLLGWARPALKDVVAVGEAGFSLSKTGFLTRDCRAGHKAFGVQSLTTAGPPVFLFLSLALLHPFLALIFKLFPWHGLLKPFLCIIGHFLQSSMPIQAKYKTTWDKRRISLFSNPNLHCIIALSHHFRPLSRVSERPQCSMGIVFLV